MYCIPRKSTNFQFGTEIESAVKSRTVCSIDQFSVQKFNIAETGFVRSPVAQLARCQTLAEYEALVKSIGVTKASHGDYNDKLSLEDNFRLKKSRFAQSPNELERYAEILAQYDSDKLDDAYRKALVSNPDDPSSVDPLSVEPSQVSSDPE